MIRINLLTVERERTARRASFQFTQKVPVLCSLILVATALLIGWWYWDLTKQAARLDEQVRASETEAARLKELITKVQQFEQRKAQLEQRVRLIEQLRRGQSGPVHLLDEISRSLPEGLWLTDIKQQDNVILIGGRCTAMSAPSDFAQNLEASEYFKKPVEILETKTEKADAGSADIIRFSLKALYAPPGT